MILTIDFGTTNLKAALVNKQGKFFNYTSKEVSICTDRDIYEINANVYLDFICEYMKTINPKQVEAIAISSNGPSFISLYSDIKVTDNKFIYESSPVRLWMDKRGAKYSKQVSDYYNTYIDGSFFLPSILSIKDADINQYNKTSAFLTIDGFINLALTNKAYTVNNADGLLKYYWNEESLNFFDLDINKFPLFIKCGDILGTISKQVSKLFDLEENVQVIAGGSDFYYSIIGSKVYDKNIMVDINGTSEGLNLCVEKPIKDNRFLCYEHPVKGFYNLSGVLSNSGIALSWLRKVLNIEDLEFNEVYNLAKKANDNNLIFLPYLTGERAPIWNPKATATLFNLTINTQREEISKAVLEGTIFAFNSVIKELELLGCTINEIHVTSAKENLDYYYQLKSDITNKKFIVYDTISAELLGLAMLSYTTLNQYPNLKQAIKDMKQESQEFTPNRDKHNYYANKFKQYNALYDLTSKLMMNKTSMQ